MPEPLEWYLGFINADPNLIPRKEPFGWKVIRYFQGYPEYELGRLVHCFLIFNINNEFHVYETTETVYRTQSLAKRSGGCPLIVFQLPGEGSAALNHVKALEGRKTPYGYPEILGLGIFLMAEKLFNIISWPIRKLFKLPYIRIKFENPYNLKLTVYCAESTLDAIVQEGIITPFKDHAAVLCPDLYGWLLSKYKPIIATEGEVIERI